MASLAWRSAIKYDPVRPLVSSGDPAVAFFAARDLLEEEEVDVEKLWELPDAQRIVGKQRADGGWEYPGGNKSLRSQENYDQLETFRNLGFLVEMYGFNRGHPAIPKAAEFLFSFQTKDGDIRGILGNQYAPYYTAAMMELLIKAGYEDDARIKKAFGWLDGMRQDDGAWAMPLRTHGKTLDVIAMNSPALEPDRSKPSSHLITGVVLRAYAAHPQYRESEIAQTAGQFLLSRFFKKDSYTDRGTPEYWLKFTFPFWFTDLISAMDSLSRLGFSKEDPEIQKALKWFAGHQDKSGLWKLYALKNKKYNNDLWLSLSICRIFKRLG